MESTSVYWIPLYELLESRGIEAVLVNARQLHNVPGRKTDFHDCQWIQLLHSCGLLRGSFRPGDAIVAMRALHRQLVNLEGQRTRCVQWMQKALNQMNVQVHHAVSDLAGTTGMAIVRAIVAGERDPSRLAALRDHRCRKSAEQIARHLTGTWREEHLFNLAGTLVIYDSLEKVIGSYEARLDAAMAALQPEERKNEPVPPHPNPHKEKDIQGSRRPSLSHGPVAILRCRFDSDRRHPNRSGADSPDRGRPEPIGVSVRAPFRVVAEAMPAHADIGRQATKEEPQRLGRQSRRQRATHGRHLASARQDGPTGRGDKKQRGPPQSGPLPLSAGEG